MSYIIVGRKKLQSTPSVGRATPDTYPAYWQEQISIHALRGEGDGRDLRKAPPRCNFYPRPPWGGRRCRLHTSSHSAYFYPRPPWGGRPLRPVGAFLPIKISIHALRGEGDDEDFVGLLATSDFYPRPPRGGGRARMRIPWGGFPHAFSIPPRRGGGDDRDADAGPLL